MTEREPSPSQDSTATSAGAAPSAHGTHAHDDPRAHERHYVRVWAALCVLLVVSVVGPMLEIPIVTLLTAFGIAVVKAYLVVRFFMHLPLEPKYVAYLGGVALFFMGLLFFFVAPDVLKHSGRMWSNVAAQSTRPAVEGDASDPAGLYAAACASCHGAEGRGDGERAPGLVVRPPSFRDPEFWATRDRERLVRVIRDGGKAAGGQLTMPAFGSQLSAEQIDALVSHLESMRPPPRRVTLQAPAPSPAAPRAAPLPPEPPAPPALAEENRARRVGFIERRLGL